MTASAATFKSVATRDGKTIILLTGEIAEGDAETLTVAIKTANDAGKLVSGVRLNSPGGNLLEDLKLADAVRFAMSTPLKKCIGSPEQKYISDAGKKAPELGAFSSGIRLGWDYPSAGPSWHGVSGACSD